MNILAVALSATNASTVVAEPLRDLFAAFSRFDIVEDESSAGAAQAAQTTMKTAIAEVRRIWSGSS